VTTSAERAGAHLLLLASSTATAAGLIWYHDFTLAERLLVLLASIGALAALVLVARLGAALDRRVTVALIVAVLALVVTVPPRATTDTSSYAAYGRMVVHEHASPYTHAAADFPHDRVMRRVAPVWQYTKSVYGPVFVGLSAAGMSVARASRAGTRAVFQGLALLATLSMLLLLVRRGVSAVALAAFGLHPTTAAIVNGGLNDVLIGLAVLGGALLAMRRRPILAGVILALGALVKIVGLLPLAGLAAWMWWRHGRRAAGQLFGSGIAVVGLAYLAVGGTTALQPLRDAGGQRSRAAIWNGLHAPIAHLIGASTNGHLAINTARATSLTANIVILAVFVLVLLGNRRRFTAAEVALLGPLVFLVGAAYALPRYAGWGIGAAALTVRSWYARLLLGWAALLQLVYLRAGPVHSAPGAAQLLWLDRFGVPVLGALTLAGLLITAARANRTDSSSSSGANQAFVHQRAL
jgi:Glycosyltransferase family 87